MNLDVKNGTPEQKSELADALFKFIMAGFTVHEKFGRIRVFKDKDRYEVIYKYDGDESYYIGKVDTYRDNGNWIYHPVLLSYFMKNKVNEASNGVMNNDDTYHRN